MIDYLIEIFLIAVSFFLPGLLLPRMENQNDFLNSPVILSIYVGLSFLQLLFMLFLVKRDLLIPKENFGLVPVKINDFILGFLYSLGLFGIFFLISALVYIFPSPLKELFHEGFRWSPENQAMIPLLFLFCVITGYREEFVFRSYIIARCGQARIKPRFAVGLSVVMFSVLHLYEGISGLVFALLSGVYLGILFVKYRNLHIIALSHAAFNFIALLLSFLRA